jgi:type IV pilus assembly protein PilM
MFGQKNKQSQQSLAVGLDFGSQQIKAVAVARGEKGPILQEYVIAPTPASLGKKGAEAEFAGQLQQALVPLTRLKATDRRVFVSVSCPTATVAVVELPRLPVDEAREVLKLNSTRYLRRDLSNSYLDVSELMEPVTDPKARKPATMRLLVAAVSKEEIQWYRTTLAAAKLRPESIELSFLTVVNAFQISHREFCEKGGAALVVDIGARMTSMNFLQHGQPVLTRIMDFGGGRITETVAQSLNLEPVAAEEEKRKLPEFMQPLVQGGLAPLAREIRASVDFFEHQYDCRVSYAFAGGGTACSATILNLLSQASGVKLVAWNPVQGWQADGDAAGLEQVAPALASAVGLAAARVAAKEGQG